jgi:type IV pilus assembly protein PilN
MARINLLPWREDLRKEQRRQFFVMLGASAFLMLLVVGYVHLHINGMIQTQESRNSYLQAQIKEVESKIKEIDNLEKQRQQLLARMRVIEQLQGDRSVIVHLFEELAKAVPDGLHVVNVKQVGKILTVQGVAQSNARVSSFMRNLDASPWFENPVLEIIQVDDKGQRGSRTFTLRVSQPASQDRG